MLRELHIANLAVIEDVRLELRPGLNVFTGQTGAGKSLVLGAFGLLLGLKPQANVLRPGAAEGRVTGTFEIRDGATLAAVRAAADLPEAEAPAGEPLLVTRKFFETGRSSAAVNGQPANAAILRRIGERLIDLHVSGDRASGGAEHETQFLLKPSNQLALVDAFAGNDDLLAEYREAFDRLRDLQERLHDSEAGRALRRDQLDLYRFQAEEIDAVEPTEGEYEELDARYRVLSQMERVLREGGLVHASLYESEGSILERLQAAQAVLNELAEIDEPLREVCELVRTSIATLQDASFTLSRYLNRQDLDAGELAEVVDRLNSLNRLISKYARGGALEDVIEYREELARRIEELERADSDTGQTEREAERMRQRLREIGRRLGQRRAEAVAALAPMVEAELRDLAMPHAAFEARFEPADEPTPSGLERLEFHIRTNPGQPMQPLRFIASGGELSRVMLGLKSVLAQAEHVSVLVFDEIDAKVGGRLGAVIGEKMRRLARRHQVLCITHLPQIAAYADHHLKIEKTVEGGVTRTTVRALESESARVEELAEMLAGRDVTATTLAQAHELIRRARDGADEPVEVEAGPRGSTAGGSRRGKSAGRATRPRKGR